MTANKKRLYIALYPSGVVGNEERRYPVKSIYVGRHVLIRLDIIGHS